MQIVSKGEYVSLMPLLAISMKGKKLQQMTFWNIFLILTRKQALTFYANYPSRENLQEMSMPIFWEK